MLAWNFLCESETTSWSRVAAHREAVSCFGTTQQAGKAQGGDISRLLCAACVCLPLTSTPPREEAGAAGPSWFCTDHLQAQRGASDWFCCIY